ncbi:Cation Diffusion Facilitator (CDF) protein [Phytophthora megakarya]|uniref:Cation Diffusion Facilitator (CDF) protein n=1 Tax=Phytophthora megakarya TaxID=4795 RepID=A0A225VJ65_9STRA|nr:Cation Diffusion Facilitator (CDF) protein [Phytophthora megakarya]
MTASAQAAQRKLQIACLCSLIFMCAEVVGGFLAGSLAIMTDAAHLLSDVAGFCISLFAIWMSTRPATNSLSFGFQRAEVIGAVTSVLLIWVLTGVLLYEAVVRFIECLDPNPIVHVNGKFMFIVAVIGLLVNLVLMQILGHGHSHGGHENSHEDNHGHSHGGGHSHDRDAKSTTAKVHAMTPTKQVTVSHGHSHNDRNHHTHGEEEKKSENLNIRSAYIHAVGDFIQSLGVCIAGGLIWLKPEWQIADPIATFIFSILVMGTTIGIIQESVHVLMEGTPHGIDIKEIEKGLQGCLSVITVHDLHIWSLSAGVPSLSVHLVSDDTDTALQSAQQYLMSKGIVHTTIQVEKPSTIYARDCKSDLKCGQLSTP